MTASLTLAQLPRPATDALAEANAALAAADHQKIVVRFKPVGGSAPPMPPKRELSRISAGQKFESVVAYLRRVLKVGQGDALFLYVNATFAPALDEVVGNLWRVSDPDLFKWLGGPLISRDIVLQGLKRPAQRWLLVDAGFWLTHGTSPISDLPTIRRTIWLPVIARD